MASRARPLNPGPLNPGPLVLAAVLLALVAGPLAAVAARAGQFVMVPQDWAAVRFTLMQATLSALISVALAVPVARALARRRFVGRQALITLMGAPFLLPAMVAVLGLLAVFGRSGIMNDLLAAMGLPPVSIYGLHGVLLAHVFLNLPLAVRMILQGWQSIPAERFRLAASLGFSPAEVARHLERPMLRAVLPGATLVIFVICLTSFAVVLTLGGGPAATTVELAIYHAVRFDFDLGRAAMLALVQLGLCAVAAGLVFGVARQVGFGAGLDRSIVMPGPGGWHRWADGAAIAAAALFLLVPLGAVVLRGVPGLAEVPDVAFTAALRSVLVAIVSAAMTVVVALVLADAVARRARGFGFLEAAAVLPLATSGLVLGTGLFLIVQPVVSPLSVALPVTVLVNTALALPYVYRLALPDAQTVAGDYGRLSDSLGVQGWARWRWIVLPRLARPVGFGAGVAAALSMGDLGVITLFAGGDQGTLPLVVQQLTGAYRMDAAAGAALLLVGLSFGLFWLCDWGGRRASA